MSCLALKPAAQRFAPFSTQHERTHSKLMSEEHVPAPTAALTPARPEQPTAAAVRRQQLPDHDHGPQETSGEKRPPPAGEPAQCTEQAASASTVVSATPPTASLRPTAAAVWHGTGPPPAAEQPQPRVGSTHAREGSVEVFMEVELEG